MSSTIEADAMVDNRRKRILILGAGDSQYPLVETCAKSYDIVLAAPVIQEAFARMATDTIIADVRDFDTIMAALSKLEPIQGVITDGTDIPVHTVAKIADALGLPGIGEEAGRLYTDKSLMRNKMDELGIPTLKHVTVHSLDEAIEEYQGFTGEVIIKPVDCQGSRGVQVCSSLEELKEKYPEAERWASPLSGRAVLLEQFIRNGREFVVEGLAFDNCFWNLCIGDTFYFDREDALSAKERCFPTIANSELRKRVLERNTQIINGFGLKQGITHSEFIMDGDEVYLIETAARGGGAFISSDLIPLSCGLDTASFLAKAAMGDISSAEELASLLGLDGAAGLDHVVDAPLNHCCYVAFYIPAGKVLSVEGAAEVLQLPYVHRTQIEGLESLVGQELTSDNSDKTTRYLVTISAPTREALEERMACVRSTIHMQVLTPDGEVTGLIWE